MAINKAWLIKNAKLHQTEAEFQAEVSRLYRDNDKPQKAIAAQKKAHMAALHAMHCLFILVHSPNNH